MENIFNSNKTPPSSIEAEKMVLGSILIKPSVFSVVMTKINSEFFYTKQHQDIFSIMSKLFTSGTNSDILTVVNEAVKLKIFDDNADGNAYLASIMNNVPSVANVESYCDIIAEKYYARRLLSITEKVAADIYEGSYNAQDLLDSAEQQIFDIRQGRDVKGLTHIKDIVYDAYEMIAKKTGVDREKYLGARTGFDYLDTITTGLNNSDLVLLGARPAMGKTAFALNIATNVAKNASKDVAIFSLEMSKEQLVTRILSSEAFVDSNKLRNGQLADDHDAWVRLAKAAGMLSHISMYIDDTAAITVQQLKAKLRRMKNLGLVVIDYLQLMSSALKTDNRVTIVGEITRQLKIMAKELNVPVILLSQLSRESDKRSDKRPMLSDLRESGSIEQDADIVLFLYRDAYYNKESEFPDISECIVAKNRHGETGTVKLGWDGQYTRFRNLEFREEES